MRLTIKEAIQKEVLEKQKRIVQVYFKNKLNQEISDLFFCPGTDSLEMTFIIHQMVIVPHTPRLEINLRCEFIRGAFIGEDYIGDPYERELDSSDKYDNEDICRTICFYIENELDEYFGIKEIYVNIDLF